MENKATMIRSSVEGVASPVQSVNSLCCHLERTSGVAVEAIGFRQSFYECPDVRIGNEILSIRLGRLNQATYVVLSQSIAQRTKGRVSVKVCDFNKPIGKSGIKKTLPAQKTINRFHKLLPTIGYEKVPTAEELFEALGA